MRTISKRKTHISTMRGTNHAQIAQISAMLGWTVQQYCDHQFDTYLYFVDYVWPESETKIGKFMRNNDDFCSFFVNEWIRRNIEFIKFADEFLSDALELSVDGLQVCEEMVLYNGKFVLHQVDDRTDSIELTNDPLVGDTHLILEYGKIHNPPRVFADDGFEKRLNYLTERIISR